MMDKKEEVNLSEIDFIEEKQSSFVMKSLQRNGTKVYETKPIFDENGTPMNRGARRMLAKLQRQKRPIKTGKHS